jgi:hypothetical protein
MSKRVQIRRGTTAESAVFTGAVGEITYDTELKCLRLHDGVTAGGKILNPLLLTLADTEAVQNVASGVHITGGGGDNNALEVDLDVLFNDDFAVLGEAFVRRYNFDPLDLAYAANLVLDFSARSAAFVTLAGNVAFTASNLSLGRQMTVRIKGDGSARTLTFPATWNWVGGTAPASLAAGKIGYLELWSYSSADADVVARYSVQS